MFKFLTSKKGFTIVELMIVLVLLSFGAFALVNLFRAGLSAFNKTEERFIKQEAVKNVVELLQKGANVTSAQTAAVYGTTAIVPNGGVSDESNSYLWAELEDRDNDGTYEGYYLYMLDAGKIRDDNLKPLSDIPMYVQFEPYWEGAPSDNGNGFRVDFTVDAAGNKIDHTDANDNYTIYPAVNIRVCAIENSAQLADENGNPLPLTSDDIFYSLDVTYHFPNIVVNGGVGSSINYTSSWPIYAEIYDESGLVEVDGKRVSVLPEDKVGVALKVHIDSILNGDNTSTDMAMPQLCFVATASYGHDSGEVGLLCNFRDQVLMKNELGKAFVKAYYTVSPPLAKMIENSEPLKAAVRTALKPLVLIATYSLDSELAADNAGYLAIFLFSGVTASAVAVACNKRIRREKSSPREQ